MLGSSFWVWVGFVGSLGQGLGLVFGLHNIICRYVCACVEKIDVKSSRNQSYPLQLPDTLRVKFRDNFECHILCRVILWMETGNENKYFKIFSKTCLSNSNVLIFCI